MSEKKDVKDVVETEDNVNQSPEDAELAALNDELTLLKDRADIMGIKYSPAIGLTKLREKVRVALLGPDEDKKVVVSKVAEPAKVVGPQKPTKTKRQLQTEYYARCRKEANRLVRCVIVNMNPNKKDWPGEIMTVGNAVVGTIKKYVPFNVEAGYHIPNMIFEHLRGRKYQQFTKKKLPGGQVKVTSGMVKEFNIQILDPLTVKELRELAKRQALNHSIDR